MDKSQTLAFNHNEIRLAMCFNENRRTSNISKTVL